MSSEQNKAAAKRLFELFTAEGLEGGLRMSVTSAIAEGAKVAVQAVSEGDLKNGRWIAR
jgi:Fe-S cluster assembly iron-binding protein IscA